MEKYNEVVVLASLVIFCKKRANNTFYDADGKKMLFLHILIKNQQYTINKFTGIACLDLYTLFHNMEDFMYFFGLHGGGKTKTMHIFRIVKGLAVFCWTVLAAPDKSPGRQLTL